MNNLFKRNYLTNLFVREETDSTFNLTPYSVITDPQLESVKDMNLMTLLFELNYRINQFQLEIKDDNNLNWDNLKHIDNHNYVSNFYHAEDIFFRLVTLLSDDNTQII